MEKLYSVKKPKSLVGVLFLLVLVISLIAALAVSGILTISYFVNHKTDAINELVFPILRSLIIILPIDSLAVFALISLMSIYRLGNKKRVFVRNINAFFDFSRADYLCLDEGDAFLGNKCVIKEMVSLNYQSSNEAADIVGSMASQIKNNDPVILALQELSYIPLFNNVNIERVGNAYQTIYKDKKYVLGRYGSFKYRSEEFVKTKVEPYLLKGYDITLVGSFSKDVKNDKYADFADVFALIVTKNAVNPEFIEAINCFQNKGIEIKFLSSKNAYAACENAKDLGIKNSERYLSACSDSGIASSDMDSFVVFANLSVDEKAQVVNAFQKERKVVCSLGGSNVVNNTQCSISYGGNSDVVLDDESASLIETFEESDMLRNKMRKLFGLAMFKSVFVDLFLIASSLFTLFGFNYVYKPVGLGVIFITIIMASLLLDNTYESKGRKLRYRLLTSFTLEILSLGVTFLLFFLQYHNVAFTGLGDMEACLSICGIIFIITQLIFLFGLFIPFSKRRIIIYASLTGFILALTGVLFGVSRYISKPLLGIYFNKLNGQNLIYILIISVMFSAIYFIVNYLKDNYHKGGDK